jgi:hypothetical protein
MPVLVYSGSFGDAVIEVDFRFHKEEGKWAKTLTDGKLATGIDCRSVSPLCCLFKFF